MAAHPDLAALLASTEMPRVRVVSKIAGGVGVETGVHAIGGDA